MSTTSEQLIVDPCPLSSGPSDRHAHLFGLEVERDTSLSFLGFRRGPRTPVPRTFVRLFNCAVKGQMFEAQVPLVESPGEKIRDVLVVSDSEPPAGDPPAPTK